MADWADLEHELALWDIAGLTPTLWWRDDDAYAATPELEPLLTLSDKHGVPAHLAVIPDLYQSNLTDRLARCANIKLLQHGFAHINHEPKGAGASEFGGNRSLVLKRADLDAGWSALTALDLPGLLPVFVPPWNRVCDETLALLPALGYRVVSAYAGPTSSLPVDGLIHANGHVDPIRWKHGKAFRGVEKTLDLFVAHLAGRREGRLPAAIPTCFLTHHKDMGPALWAFVDELFDRLARQGHAKWIDLSSLIEPTGGSDA